MQQLRIDSILAGLARSRPGRWAITFKDTRLDFAGLEAQAARMAGWLASRGVGSGDRVAIYARNHPESFILLFAASRIGAMMVPLNWRLSEEELAWQLADAAPSMLLYGADFAGIAGKLASHAGCPGFEIGTKLDAARESHGMEAEEGPGGPDAELMVVYTSGTTGRPKGAVLAQAAMRANAEMSHHAYAMTPDDHVLNILPLFHVGGLNIQPLPALLAGAGVVIHDGFDPAAVLSAIRAEGITQITVVPTILSALLAAPEWTEADLSSLRMMAIGSTDVPVALIEAVHARGIPVVQVYGATETSPTAIYQTADIATATVGSIGRAGSRCEIRITGDDGTELPVGEVGEIRVRGDNILTRYWNNEAASTESIADGWFRTGDQGFFDADGYLKITGRLKEIINRGGEKVSPLEVDNVLMEHPAVQQVVTFAVADKMLGEEIGAAVVLADGGDLDAAGLRAYAGEHLAKFKIPKHVVFVTEIPKGATGKLQRIGLAEKLGLGD